MDEQALITRVSKGAKDGSLRDEPDPDWDPDDDCSERAARFADAVAAAERFAQRGSCLAMLRRMREMLRLLPAHEEVPPGDWGVFGALEADFASLCGAVARVRKGGRAPHVGLLRDVGGALAGIAERVVEHSPLWFFVRFYEGELRGLDPEEGDDGDEAGGDESDIEAMELAMEDDDMEMEELDADDQAQARTAAGPNARLQAAHRFAR